MNVKYAFFADAVSIDRDGKVNALGIFDVLLVRRLPVTHARMYYVVKIHYPRAEYGAHRVELTLINPDGVPVMPTQELGVNIVEGNDSSTHIIDFNRVSFDTAGPHEMVVAVDGVRIGACGLSVTIV